MSTTERSSFVRAVLDLYLGLPHSAARRPSRNDRRLAGQLFDRGITLQIIRAAMLLAMARRTQRPIDAPTLTPIRSLYYFAPVIDELLASSPDHCFIDYINDRWQHLLTRPDGHIPTFSDGR
ncbi:MAG: hypothetical protein ACRDJ2_12535 [Actinomycetota bacterium]